jgi:methionyl-tRNA formyltransferase
MGVRKTVEDPAPSQPNSGTQTAIEYCKQHGIATLRVGPLVTEDAQTKIRKLNPDVLVQAGVGILRKGLLDIPSIGTLNVHMSILPLYRGMNVGEWAAFNGHRNGCTVHLIDEGIDTGDVLLVREVSREGCNSIQALRRDIDTAQRELLAEVLEYIAKTGSPPPSYRQESESGMQYFAMHPDLQRILTDELAREEKGSGLIY